MQGPLLSYRICVQLSVTRGEASLQQKFVLYYADAACDTVVCQYVSRLFSLRVSTGWLDYKRVQTQVLTTGRPEFPHKSVMSLSSGRRAGHPRPRSSLTGAPAGERTAEAALLAASPQHPYIAVVWWPAIA